MNCNIIILVCVSSDAAAAAAAAAGGLSTDVIGCTSVGVLRATLMRKLESQSTAALLRL